MRGVRHVESTETMRKYNGREFAYGVGIIIGCWDQLVSL
jgi:hypothetical protein